METSCFDDLRAAMRGVVLEPDHADYETARHVYNAMIERRPAAIARCVDVADVIAAVAFARAHDLPVAVRGGGHSAAGKGTCDNGLVIDLSPMKGIRIDPQQRVARVAGGATWGDFDHAGHVFGLATPGGIFSTTGVGGLTLGGGFGYLTRKYGLSCDNLLSADVVTADGQFLTANDEEHADLFWALRGGGGNFGVVTSFQFRMHPVSTVYGGPILYPLAHAADLLRFYRSWMVEAPEDVSAFFAFLIAPPAPLCQRSCKAPRCAVSWSATSVRSRRPSAISVPRARWWRRRSTSPVRSPIPR
jgi:FAD/FMN-containing dehydrogenase